MFKLIHNNPFRVLSLPVDADTRLISSRQAELKMYLQIGNTEDMADEFRSLLPPIEYSTENIQEAYNSLSKDAERIYHSLFWFQKHTYTDGLAIDALKAGRPEVAARVWKAQVESDPINEENYTSYKNLALLYIITFPREKNLQSKQCALKGVNLFFQSWCFFSCCRFYKKLPGTAYISDIDHLAGRLITEFVAGFRPFMGRGVCFTITDILVTLPCLAAMDNLKNRLAREFSSGPLERLTRKIDQADQELNFDKADYYNIGAKLLNDTKNMHNEADVLIPEQEYLLISDKLAHTVAKSAILYFNREEANPNWELKSAQAVKLAEEARQIARSETTILKIEEDMLDFKKISQQFGYRGDFNAILKKLPQIIYKLSEQGIGDYPNQVSAAVDQAEVLLQKIEQEQGAYSEVTSFMSDIIMRSLFNLLIDYANHTYRFKAIVPVINKLSKFKASREVREYFNRNIEVLNQNIKEEAGSDKDSNDDWSGVVFFIIIVIAIIIIYLWNR